MQSNGVPHNHAEDDGDQDEADQPVEADAGIDQFRQANRNHNDDRRQHYPGNQLRSLIDRRAEQDVLEPVGPSGDWSVVHLARFALGQFGIVSQEHPVRTVPAWISYELSR